MVKNTKRGFTLIELLVVIAIIGILSSVVLASLNTARSKGNDAKVKAQISGARAAAELYYSSANNYGAASTYSTAVPCAGAMFVDTASSMATYANSANYPTGTLVYCTANIVSSPSYSLIGSLAGNSTNNTWWCVDSSGASTMVTAAAAAITAAGATPANVDTCAEIEAL